MNQQAAMRMEMSNLRAAQKDLGDGRRWFGKGRERKKKERKNAYRIGITKTQQKGSDWQ